MQEEQELSVEQPFSKTLRLHPRRPVSGLGETSTSNAFASPAFPTVHKRLVKTTFKLVVAALAAVFLVSHCHLWNRTLEVSHSTRRRLGDGEYNEGQQGSVFPTVCGHIMEAEGQPHEEDISVGRPLPPAAELATVEGGDKSKELPQQTHGDRESTLGRHFTEVHGDDWESKALELLDSLLQEEAALEPSEIPCVHPSPSEPMRGMRYGAPTGGPALEHSLTYAIRASLSGETYDCSYGGESPTGSNGQQQQSLDLRFEEIRDVGGESDVDSFVPASSSDRSFLAPSQAFAEMTQEHLSNTPSLNSAATGAAGIQSSEFSLHASPTSSELVAPSTSGVSASAGASTGHVMQLDKPDLSQHLFYRLPKWRPSSRLVHLRVEEIKFPGQTRKLPDHLDSFRKLFVKDQLTDAEVQSLIDHSESLLRHVNRIMRPAFTARFPTELMDHLGRRFLVADALFCACELAGEAMEMREWWEATMARLSHVPEKWLQRVKSGSNAQTRQEVTSKLLCRAMKQYQKGRRPDVKHVVGLKQELLVNRSRGSDFFDPAWDPWRMDNIISLKYLGLGENFAPLPVLHILPVVQQMRTQDAPSTSGASAVVGPGRRQVVLVPSLDFSQHLFYRLPETTPSSSLEKLRVHETHRRGSCRTLQSLLKSFRELLVKEQLTDGEVQCLVFRTEDLLRYVNRVLSLDFLTRLPGEVLEHAGRRFLIADALFCACEVVGEAMLKDVWWRETMLRLSHVPQTWSPRPSPSSNRSSRTVVERLFAALNEYLEGRRPHAKEIVELKSELFCCGNSRSYFRNSIWDAWRRDHEASMKRLQSGEAVCSSSLMPASRAMNPALPTAVFSTSARTSVDETSSTYQEP